MKPFLKETATHIIILIIAILTISAIGFLFSLYLDNQMSQCHAANTPIKHCGPVWSTAKHMLVGAAVAFPALLFIYESIYYQKSYKKRYSVPKLIHFSIPLLILVAYAALFVLQFYTVQL